MRIHSVLNLITKSLCGVCGQLVIVILWAFVSVISVNTNTNSNSNRQVNNLWMVTAVFQLSQAQERYLFLCLPIVVYNLLNSIIN